MFSFADMMGSVYGFLYKVKKEIKIEPADLLMNLNSNEMFGYKKMGNDDLTSREQCDYVVCAS